MERKIMTPHKTGKINRTKVRAAVKRASKIMKERKMKTGEHTNEHGVRVTEHTCDTCGVEFTICPGIDDYPDCGDIDCESYNPDSELSDEEIKSLINNPSKEPRMVIH